jgi:hypothetical protein
VGENQVISVAIIASGGDDQTLLEQSFAVNALGIVGEDIMFGDVIHTGHRSSLPVALPAQYGNVHLVSSRADIRGGEDVVLPVTFVAGRGVGGSSFQGSSVNTGIKLFIRHIVTNPAVYSLQRLGVGEFLHIGILMAVDAFRIFVYGFRKKLEIHEHRNSAALSSCR